MKITKRKFLFFTLVLSTGFILALFSINLDRYSQKVAQALTLSARAHGIGLNMKNPKLSISGFSSEETGLFIPAKIPLSILLQNSNVALSLQSLFSFNPGFTLTSELYSGSAWVTVTPPGLDRKGKAAFNFVELNLSQHPQLQGLGLQGVLSFTGDDIQFNDQALTNGTFHIKVISGSKPQANVWDLKNFGLPIKAELPKIDSFSAETKLTLNGTAANLDQFIFNSSIMNIKAQGSAIKEMSQYNKLDIDAVIELSDLGVQILGKYLAFLNQKYSTNTKLLKLRINGSSKLPKLIWE